MDPSESSATDRVADRLRDRAEALTDRWLSRLEERLNLRPTEILPTEKLRDYIPEVLRELAESLRSNRASRAPRVSGRLGDLAELRLRQGYDAAEILVEFEMLTGLVDDEVRDELRAADAGPEERVAVFGEVRDHLLELVRITVGSFESAHREHQARVRERLAGFAHTLEHEIRNPLQSALGYADLLEGELGTGRAEARERYVETVRKHLGRIEELIADLHDLTFAEEEIAERRWLPVASVVRAVREEVGPLAEREGVDVRIERPLPPIEVDDIPVRVALLNLVTNGIKYADPEEDDRRVVVSAGKVEANGAGGAGPRASGNPGEGKGAGPWMIRVDDNGVGIPDEMSDRMFRRFVRGADESAEGTGLGLAIVKEIMEQRGGDISFTSREGVGSTFVLELSDRMARPFPEPEAAGERDGQEDGAHGVEVGVDG